MNKEVLEDNNPYEQLTAAEIWKKSYGKEMNCKKHLIEYIDIMKVLKKNLSEDQLKESYKYIYEHIEGLKDCIKPNTMMFLKNSLKAQLGKYVKDKDPKQVNHFIEFFEKAYPKNYRRSDYTRVLMDLNTISEEQIWTTLTYINRECLSGNLSLNSNQKKDIIGIIELSVRKNNIKFINMIRSLKKLSDELNICIVSVDGVFKVRDK